MCKNNKASDRLEFLQIFTEVRHAAIKEWEIKNGKLPPGKREDPPQFLDLVNRTLQFVWYVDGYRPPETPVERTTVEIGLDTAATDSGESVEIE